MSAPKLRLVDVSATDSGDHLRAFLAVVQPLQNCELSADHQIGRDHVTLLLAAHWAGKEPAPWSTAECAQVLYFLGTIEPKPGKCYCRGDEETCGMNLVLYHMQHQMEEACDSTA